MITSRGEYPRIISLLTRPGFQILFALISFVAIVIFDISVFIFRPYDGLVFGDYEPTLVASVDKGSPVEKAGILPGDKLLMVDGKPVDPWLYQPIYPAGIKAGDTVVYQIERNGQILNIHAVVGGFFDHALFYGQILGMQILSVAFWLIGISLCLFTLQADVRARLAGLAWLVTGIGVASGGPAGASFFWGSGTTMKVTWAFLGFLFIALHLYFPAPRLSTVLRKRMINVLATVSIILAVITIIDDTVFKIRLSTYTGLNNLVYGFFLISVLVSLGLLLLGYFRAVDLDLKRQNRIILSGMAFGLLPFLTLTLLPLLFGQPYIDGELTSLFLILIPLSYAYVIYQRKLLKVDFIINRLVVFFVMGLLVLISSFLILMLFSKAMNLPASVPIAGSLMAVFVTLPSAGLRDRANRWVSLTLYGAYYDHASVAGSLSNRLAQALDRRTLVDLLTADLAKQMGIQKTALFLLEGEHLKLFQQLGEEDCSIRQDDQCCKILLDARSPVRAQNLWPLLSGDAQGNWLRFSWAELFVPLIFENRVQGILLLGDRIAGDIYSDQDVRIIATVADQGALAVANIQLVETLRGLSQQLVRAGEDERKQVVRELHDGVLQNLFFIRQIVRQQPDAVKHLSDVITTLRGILKAQRPYVLDFGLVPALEDLVTNMKALAGQNGLYLEWRSTAENISLPDEQATAIYRIAQESISNAIRHAQAHHILVSLESDNKDLVLTVEDDGVGIPKNLALEGQYGLIGMRERALMIGANLHILSNYAEGTKIILEHKLC